MPPLNDVHETGAGQRPFTTTETDNRLLAALPPEELGRIRPMLETVPLEFKLLLHGPDRPIDHVWFPHIGVLSLVNEVPESRPVEVATVGNEGFTGVPLLLGADTMPTQCICQIPGAASRMGSGAFRDAQDANPVFRALLLRYTLALLNQVAQSASCNRAHSIDERCARWLLMTHDRVNGAKHFPLTQEFLAQMLGVRRASVSVAQAILQRAGLIRYTRGSISVLDREGLEAASCPCYGIIRTGYNRLLP